MVLEKWVQTFPHHTVPEKCKNQLLQDRGQFFADDPLYRQELRPERMTESFRPLEVENNCGAVKGLRNIDFVPQIARVNCLKLSAQ